MIDIIFARDSVATRYIIIFNEKLPETAFAIVNDVEVAGEAAVRVRVTVFEMLARPVTQLYVV